MNDKLDELFAVLEKNFGAEGRADGDQAMRALKQAQHIELNLTDTNSAPVSLIGQAVAQQNALPIAKTIFDCCRSFHWQNWAEDVLENKISNNLFTTELIGPDGLIHNPEVRIGLLVSASHMNYPVSSHSGEETYLVISGTAQWIVEGESYRWVAPGETVHHPAWVAHGRRTHEEVFLGAWRWSGELKLDSFRLN